MQLLRSTTACPLVAGFVLFNTELQPRWAAIASILPTLLPVFERRASGGCAKEPQGSSQSDGMTARGWVCVIGKITNSRPARQVMVRRGGGGALVMLHQT